MFVDAVREPIRERDARDGTVDCVALLLAVGVLARGAGALWPAWASLVPAALAALPILLFVGYLGGVLVGETPAFLTRRTAKRGAEVGLVVAVYLLPPALAVVTVAYVIGSGAVPAAASGVVGAVLASVALVVAVVCTYLLPAAAVAAAAEGVRAGFRRSSRRGTASGAYFVAWVGAAVLLVLAWGALGATAERGIGAVVALCWFGYAHVAAATLVREGMERARG